MLYYSFYHVSAEAYLWIGATLTPLLCVLGWLLLDKAISKHLHSFVHWFLPFMVGSSLSATAFLLTAFMRATHSRDYALGSVVYLLPLAGFPFHIVWLVRLWKTITTLPLSSGEQPLAQTLEQDSSVWPPQPRR